MHKGFGSNEIDTIKVVYEYIAMKDLSIWVSDNLKVVHAGYSSPNAVDLFRVPAPFLQHHSHFPPDVASGEVLGLVGV